MEKEYKVQTRFLFHTNIKIKIPDSFENKVFDELFEILEDVNKNSYIDKINKNNGKFVQVNEETVNLLEKVVHFSEIMNGEYDITIMPLIKLWGFYKENSDKIPENPEPEKKLLKNDDGKILKITKEKYEGNDEYNDLFEIEIKDLTYSTSNQVNTFLEIDGEKYGHIISPKTGFPAKNKQIGIITENAFFGDMISTGLYNQTPKNFHEIIKNFQKK